MASYTSMLISGKPVSGKSTLASVLSKMYGWEVFSVGKLWREEWERKYPNQKVKFEDFWGKTSAEDNLKMDKKAKDILEEGGVIGDMRVSALTTDPKVLKVFVDADIDVRIERAKNKKEYKDLPDKKIRAILNKREKDELKMYKSTYGKSYDYRNPLNYHLVLNSGMLKLENEAKAIAELME